MREHKAICSYANTPRLSPAARGRVQRAIRQRLVAALLRARPGVRLHSSAKHSLVAWMIANKKVCGFTLCPYDDYAWRISSRNIAGYFCYSNQHRRVQWLTAQFPEHTFELSFLGSEVPLVAVPELFEFVESMASVKCEADAFKHYAWTRAGGPEVLRLQRARAKRESAELLNEGTSLRREASRREHGSKTTDPGAKGRAKTRAKAPAGG
jgi:hypothetical protein